LTFFSCDSSFKFLFLLKTFGRFLGLKEFFGNEHYNGNRHASISYSRKSRQREVFGVFFPPGCGSGGFLL
jgi:hypothetical protein